jgi:CheY-like chemotaxis protein/HPt (histidine-containing phosphotransfer) domain-containing protein
VLIERMLDKNGHTLVNATDGQRALELLESDRYDLVLMDCQMPVLDGYDTTREIRRREAAEQRRRIPIVAMTANAMLEDRERCLAAGMDDYMAKPITRGILDDILTRWLAPTPEDTELFDKDRLTELRSLFPPDEMSTMFKDVAAAIATELDEIGTAITHDDRAGLAAAAHRLNNNAAIIGATGLAHTAAELKCRADTDRPGTASWDGTAAQALVDQWNTTRAAIEAQLTAAE